MAATGRAASWAILDSHRRSRADPLALIAPSSLPGSLVLHSYESLDATRASAGEAGIDRRQEWV